MNPETLIEAFVEAVKQGDIVFDSESIQDIPTLQTKLTALDNPTIQTLADTIRQWYINHESVRDEVMILEREISRVKNADSNSQEVTVTNIFPVLEDELEKLKNKQKEEKEKNS